MQQSRRSYYDPETFVDALRYILSDRNRNRVENVIAVARLIITEKRSEGRLIECDCVQLVLVCVFGQAKNTRLLLTYRLSSSVSRLSSTFRSPPPLSSSCPSSAFPPPPHLPLLCLPPFPPPPCSVPKGIQQDAQEFNKNLITALENLFERCPDQAKRTGLLEGLNVFKGKQSYDKDSLLYSV